MDERMFLLADELMQRESGRSDFDGFLRKLAEVGLERGYLTNPDGLPHTQLHRLFSAREQRTLRGLLRNIDLRQHQRASAVGPKPPKDSEESDRFVPNEDPFTPALADGSLDQVKCQVLKARHRLLLTQFREVNRQFDLTLSAADRVKMKQMIARLEQDLADVEAALASCRD